MRSDFSTFFNSFRSRSRVRSSRRVFLLERRAVRWVGRDLVFAQMLASVVGVAQDLVANFQQQLLEERELRFVHL